MSWNLTRKVEEIYFFKKIYLLERERDQGERQREEERIPNRRPTKHGAQ